MGAAIDDIVKRATARAVAPTTSSPFYLANQPEPDKPSFLSKLLYPVQTGLELVTRPAQAILAGGLAAVNDEDAGAAASEAWRGKNPTFGKDVLTEGFGMDPNKFSTTALGFAVDVLNPTDPLNYVGFGLTKLGRLNKLAKSAKVVDIAGGLTRVNRARAAEHGMFSALQFAGIPITPRAVNVAVGKGLDYTLGGIEQSRPFQAMRKVVGGRKYNERLLGEFPQDVRDAVVHFVKGNEADGVSGVVNVGNILHGLQKKHPKEMMDLASVTHELSGGDPDKAVNMLVNDVLELPLIKPLSPVERKQIYAQMKPYIESNQKISTEYGRLFAHQMQGATEALHATEWGVTHSGVIELKDLVKNFGEATPGDVMKTVMDDEQRDFWRAPPWATILLTWETPKQIRAESAFFDSEDSARHFIETELIPKTRKNPPYSGYDPRYPTRKMPKDPTKISYKTKRDALNVFIDWNSSIIDEAFSGPSARQPYDSFDNINHRFGLTGSRRVDTFAKALWWAMPAGSPFYLEDIDVEMLNATSPMIHNTDRRLTLPDYAEEQRLLEKQRDYYESRYYADEEEVPF